MIRVQPLFPRGTTSTPPPSAPHPFIIDSFILLIIACSTHVPTYRQAYAEQVHTAPHGTKGKRFQAVTEKINTLKMFVEAGGVTQSRVEDVYRRIMTAHRDKLSNGERKSRDLEGSPINSLQYLCHNIMCEEEEYSLAKGGGSRAEDKQAAADMNEARVQEVRASRRFSMRT